MQKPEGLGAIAQSGHAEITASAGAIVQADIVIIGTQRRDDPVLRSDDTAEHLMVAVLQLLAPLDEFPDPLRAARVSPFFVGGLCRPGETLKACELLGLLRVDFLKLVDTTTDETVRSAQHRVLTIQSLTNL